MRSCFQWPTSWIQQYLEKTISVWAFLTPSQMIPKPWTVGQEPSFALQVCLADLTRNALEVIKTIVIWCTQSDLRCTIKISKSHSSRWQWPLYINHKGFQNCSLLESLCCYYVFRRIISTNGYWRQTFLKLVAWLLISTSHAFHDKSWEVHVVCPFVFFVVAVLRLHKNCNRYHQTPS